MCTAPLVVARCSRSRTWLSLQGPRPPDSTAGLSRVRRHRGRSPLGSQFESQEEPSYCPSVSNLRKNWPFLKTANKLSGDQRVSSQTNKNRTPQPPKASRDVLHGLLLRFENSAVVFAGDGAP
ncbi:hypothetical protein GN956_G3567 [Arapaima gigas]